MSQLYITDSFSAILSQLQPTDCGLKELKYFWKMTVMLIQRMKMKNKKRNQNQIHTHSQRNPMKHHT
jgi:hypothetical protein